MEPWKWKDVQTQIPAKSNRRPSLEELDEQIDVPDWIGVGSDQRVGERGRVKQRSRNRHKIYGDRE